MTTAVDVAAFILREHGPQEPMKLQKLVYYTQAWSLAWDGQPAFAERIEAWQHGPCVPDLYREHRRQQVTDHVPGDPDAVRGRLAAIVAAVMDHYGHLSSWQIRRRTHDERPWQVTRGDLAEWERSNEEIRQRTIRDYYALQAIKGQDVPRQPPTEAVDADYDVAMTVARRQIESLRPTLDWLATR